MKFTGRKLTDEGLFVRIFVLEPNVNLMTIDDCCVIDVASKMSERPVAIRRARCDDHQRAGLNIANGLRLVEEEHGAGFNEMSDHAALAFR